MVCKLKENRVRRSYLGGARIDKFYGRESNGNGYFPEDWIGSVVLANNPGYFVEGEGLSQTEDGKMLIDIIDQNPLEVLGTDKMPILLKLLDSAERLVIQGHPTIPFAKKHFNSDFGKTECWYFIDCDEDACVYIGFKKGVTREKWTTYFENQDVEGLLSCLHKLKVKPGQLVFVEGGVPHAIGGGSLMLELQEPTDLMVCAEKVTPSGVKLPDQKVHGGLGYDKMLDCFVYDTYTEQEVIDRFVITPKPIENGKVILDKKVSGKFFMQEIYAGEFLSDKLVLAVVVEGSGQISYANETVKIAKGDRLFISKNEKITVNGDNLRVVICGA